MSHLLNIRRHPQTSEVFGRSTNYMFEKMCVCVLRSLIRFGRLKLFGYLLHLIAVLHPEMNKIKTITSESTVFGRSFG